MKLTCLYNLYISMSVSNDNISLNIERSLSYTIDKQLDYEIGKNVDLNLQEWQSVFDIVKTDSATDEKQYRGSDNNIKRGDNFIVNAGQAYQITKNAWNQILEIAKSNVERLYGKESSDEEVVVTTSPDKKEQVKQTPEEKIQTILKNAGISLEQESEELQADVVSKYNTMLAVAKANGQNLTDEEIQTRLSNYVKGWKYTNFEKEVVKKGDLTLNYDEHYKSGFKNLDEMKEGYKNFGDAFVEYYDQDGANDSESKDKNINLHEMFYSSLVDFYTGKGMNKIEARKKAIDATQKYKEFELSQIGTWKLDDSDEAELLSAVAVKISTLDQDKDFRISTDEAGAYLMTIAKAKDDKNSITGEEIISTAVAIENEQPALSRNLKTYFDFLTK